MLFVLFVHSPVECGVGRFADITGVSVIGSKCHAGVVASSTCIICTGSCAGMIQDLARAKHRMAT